MHRTVSSGTPEGSPNFCPVCFGVISVEPSRPPGDAPCPRCGTLLWFDGSTDPVWFHEAEVIEPIRQAVGEIINLHTPFHATVSPGISDFLVAQFLELSRTTELSLWELIDRFQRRFKHHPDHSPLMVFAAISALAKLEAGN